MNTQVKPSGTSAASTAFCAAKIDGPDGFLWIDGNGKITAGNGTLNEPKPNAFSLLHIEDCPFSTIACRESCYVHGLQKHATDTYELYRHNSAEIRRILASPDRRAWVSIVGDWIEQNCQGGFRWHVSGDIFSPEYASWIGAVTRRSPTVLHWIYTRSFPFVPALLNESDENLVVNLSCDHNNYLGAQLTAERYGLRLCYLTRDGAIPGDLPNDSVIFPDYELRGGTPKGAVWFELLQPRQKRMTCPVDMWGKADNRRCGPCDRCLIQPEVAHHG